MSVLSDSASVLHVLPMNLLDICSGSVIDLQNVLIPPEWRIIDVFESLGNSAMKKDLHYRTTVRERHSFPRYKALDYPESFIQPKREISQGLPIHTLYKRKADKIHPANMPLSDGSVPEGYPR